MTEWSSRVPAVAKPRREEQEPAGTDIVEVAPGVLRLQLPIHMPGLGHVNCYVLSDERGVAVVDPGFPGPASWRALQQRLRAAEEQRVNETPEKKVAEQYPPPPTDDPPPPTFRQALVGYGSIIAALVALGVLIGVLIKVLR